MMAKVTKYECDKCDHVQDKCEQMWTIGVGWISLPNTRVNTVPANTQLWCRTCMVDAGFLPTKKQSETTVKPVKLTLAEMIEEIVEDKMAEYL